MLHYMVQIIPATFFVQITQNVHYVCFYVQVEVGWNEGDEMNTNCPFICMP